MSTVSNACCPWVTPFLFPEGLSIHGCIILLWNSKQWPFGREIKEIYHSLFISIMFKEIFAGEPHHVVLGSSRTGFLDLQSKFNEYQNFGNFCDAADVQGWKTGGSVTSYFSHNSQKSVDCLRSVRCLGLCNHSSDDSRHPVLTSVAGTWTTWFAQLSRSPFPVWQCLVTSIIQGTQLPAALQSPQVTSITHLSVVVLQKVQCKCYGTDGTCFEKVVYKGTLQSPYVLNYLCISKNMILQYI